MAEKVIAKENLYLTADRSKVVSEDSPEQAFQLIGKGSEIPAWAVEKFGLQNGGVTKTKTAVGGEEDGEKASGPKSNKAAKAKENK